jgi:hypothetical protein
MPFTYGTALTLVHRVLSGLDDYGNDTYRDEPETVAGAVVAPQGSFEQVQWTDQVSTTIVAYLPYGTAVGPLDAILYNGRTYEIQGEPQSFRSPFSNNTAPVEVRAQVVTGASA